jgi:hypothetical protein
MYQGERIPPAFGILSDISEAGACIETDRILARGQMLQMRIQFSAQPELFEAQGWVRWTKPALVGTNGSKGGALSGIELVVPSTQAVLKLRRLLESPDFELPDAGSQQFEEFLEALRPFLQRLGGLLDELSRQKTGD